MSEESIEFNRLFANFVANRITYGATSEEAGKAFLALVRYCEANAEQIWDFDYIRWKLAERGR